MNNNPLVSVVIPAYNHERFIGPAMDSVLKQTYRNLELIVIDDGSRDGTGQVARSHADHRTSVYHQKNQDAFNTINRGLGMAKGDFVAILNSDDIYALDRLEKLLAIHQETGAACLFTDVIPISDDGRELLDPAFGWNVWHQKNRDWYFACKDLYTAFLKGNFMVTTSNLFMTAEAVRKAGNFCSLRYLHDYDYIFRMLLAFPGQVRYVDDQKLLFYRIHGGNTLSEAAVTGRMQDLEVIRKYMLAALPEQHRGLAAAGTERLLELKDELEQVRAELAGRTEPSVRDRAKLLAAAVRFKLRKKLARLL